MYIYIETNSLVTLVGKNENGMQWETIGTDKDTINLDSKTIAKTNNDILCYLLPVTDETKAQSFITNVCKNKNIVAMLIDDANAQIKYDELKVIK